MTKHRKVLLRPDGVTRPRSTRLPIRILSHNIRYATQNPFKGEELWTVRRSRMINELRDATLYNQEAFICLQEVLNNQLLDILDGLNRGSATWKYIGVGRDDGKTAGEYSPIIYRPNIWKLLDFKSVWLSETPDRPSKGWDAASIRILTIGTFKHRHSGAEVVTMSTHLDDQGSQSRFESAKIIVEKIRDASPLPVLLAGDFNSEPGEEAYQVLAEEDSPVNDLRGLVPEADRYGNEDTFTGFDFAELTRIDFLFTSKGGVWEAQGYSVLANVFDDGVIYSDHRAVVGDVVLNTSS